MQALSKESETINSVYVVQVSVLHVELGYRGYHYTTQAEVAVLKIRDEALSLVQRPLRTCSLSFALHLVSLCIFLSSFCLFAHLFEALLRKLLNLKRAVHFSRVLSLPFSGSSGKFLEPLLFNFLYFKIFLALFFFTL